MLNQQKNQPWSNYYSYGQPLYEIWSPRKPQPPLRPNRTPDHPPTSAVSEKRKSPRVLISKRPAHPGSRLSEFLAFILVLILPWPLAERETATRPWQLVSTFRSNADPALEPTHNTTCTGWTLVSLSGRYVVLGYFHSGSAVIIWERPDRWYAVIWCVRQLRRRHVGDAALMCVRYLHR